jgi:hypothetical protein
VRKRRVILLGLGTLLAGFLAAATAYGSYRGTDVFSNTALAPGNSVGGLADKYPLSAFNLDTHIDTGTLGVSAVPETVASWFASQLWSIAVLLVKGVTQLFSFAFGLKLLTGAHGALAPVADAVHSLYDSVFGDLLIASLLVAGMWATWRSFVQRRHTDAAVGLGLTIVLMVVSFFFVLTPVTTVTTVAGWGDEVSLAILGSGTASDPASAKRVVTDRMFSSLVVEPWKILEFGGDQVCVDLSNRDSDGVPRPVSPHASNAHCRDTAVFAARYLEQPTDSDARNAEYDAINQGKVPSGDPQFPPSYQLSDADRPAVDMQ